MIYRDINGKLKVYFSRQDVIDALEKWRQKPETKEMIARLATERRDIIDKVLAETRTKSK